MPWPLSLSDCSYASPVRLRIRDLVSMPEIHVYLKKLHIIARTRLDAAAITKKGFAWAGLILLQFMLSLWNAI